MGDNAALTAAKRAKKDEFYTQRVDIENELRHYKPHFKGKVVLCNCDDPRQSEFFKYFAENFEKLGLKRLVATCYKSQDVDLFSQGECERAVYQIYEGDKNGNMTPKTSHTLNRVPCILYNNVCADAYYNKNEPIISDAQFDALFDELTAIEKELGVVLDNSPTKNVGYEVLSALQKVEHNIPLLSLP